MFVSTPAPLFTYVVLTRNSEKLAYLPSFCKFKEEVKAAENSNGMVKDHECRLYHPVQNNLMKTVKWTGNYPKKA